MEAMNFTGHVRGKITGSFIFWALKPTEPGHVLWPTDNELQFTRWPTEHLWMPFPLQCEQSMPLLLNTYNNAVNATGFC